MTKQEREIEDENYIPDDECKALLEWVDALTIGELKKLKEFYDKFFTTKQQ